MAPIVPNRIKIENFSRLKIAENLDFRLILCKMIQPWVRQFNGKMRIFCYPRKTRKNYQFYITVCFFYLASDVFSIVRQYDRKTNLRRPQAKKKSYFFRLCRPTAFKCLVSFQANMPA